MNPMVYYPSYPVIGGVDGGECDAPVKFPWPSDVDNLKARVNTLAESTDIDVQKCAGLASAERQSWKLFIESWRKFMATPTPTFGSYGLWVNACAYAHTLDAWRELIKKKCVLSAPTDIKGASEGLTSATKWLVGGVIAIAAVTTLLVYSPEIKAILPKSKSK